MFDPLHYEDLQPGDQWRSASREVTAEDVSDFASLTGDNDPLHARQENAAESPFGQPVAHGLLGLSLLAGLSSTRPRVATLALVGISNWIFEAPVYFGDSVHVVTTVKDLDAHGRRAGRVTWDRQLVNQHGRVVQQGTLVTLVARRKRVKPAGPPAPPPQPTSRWHRTGKRRPGDPSPSSDVAMTRCIA